MTDPKETELPEAAGALLAKWPDTPASEESWESRAEAIDAAVAEARVGDTDDGLLAAPLPARPDEGAFEEARVSSVETKSSRRQSLADLARTVADARDDESVRDIAAASLSLATRERLEGAPSLIAERNAPPAGVPQSPVSAASQVVAAPEVVAAPASTAQPPPGSPQVAPARAGVYVGVTAAVLGLAAAFAIYATRPAANQPPALALDEPPAEPAAAVAPREKARATNEHGEEIVDLSELPTGEEAARAKRTAGTGGAAAAPAGPEAKPGSAAAEPAPSPAMAKADEEAKKASKTEGEKLAAEGAEDAKMRMAEGDTKRLQPSTGEVQAAIGSVLGNARACVTAMDKPSRATVTFGSDGRVQSVTVGGAAAGLPAAGCIRAALKQARVQPFAKSSFSAATTIRPK